MTGIITVELKELTHKIGSGATPRGGSSVYLETGEFRLIRSQNVRENEFDHQGIVYITESAAGQLSNVEVFEEDVLINITGDSVARVCLVDPSVLPARVNQHVAIIRTDPKKLSPLFLNYTLNSWALQYRLLGLAAAGATRKALTKSMLETLEIQVPSIEYQKQIAHKLKTLDDKIALNRRTNATLEAMAQALFKSWFVDFDPVIDNALDAGHALPDALATRVARRKAVRANGDYAPLAAEVRALFPASFAWSEALGKFVPEGWGVKPVGEIAHLNPESWTSKTKPENIEYLDLSGANAGQISSTTNYAWEEAPSRAKRILRKGDIAYGLVRPGNKSFALIDREGLTGSTGFGVFRAKEPFWQSFLTVELTRDETIEYFAHLADGGAYPAIRPDAIEEYQFCKPTDGIAQYFHNQIDKYRNFQFSLIHESTTLSTLRDVLLGELIG